MDDNTGAPAPILAPAPAPVSMKRIKRVPWRHRQDLVELYHLIWDEWGVDEERRRRGVSRLSIYISSPSCPLFFPLLHSLLVSSLLPHSPNTVDGSSSYLTSRLTYSMSLVRFVNGMVDHMQTSVYAKPIALLARQLGIPAELVGLRHQATHEDLPSLNVLRRAVEEAIEYLRVNAFWPMIQDLVAGGQSLRSSRVQSALEQEREAVRADRFKKKRAKTVQKVDGLLKHYKKVMKAYYLDGGVAASANKGEDNKRRQSSSRGNNHELRQVFRDFEDLLQAELDDRNAQTEEDEEPVSVIVGVLIECLLKPGALVPSSKRKRPDVDAIGGQLLALSSSSSSSHAGGNSASFTSLLCLLDVSSANVKIWLHLLRFLATQLDPHLRKSSDEEKDDDEEQADEVKVSLSFIGELMRACVIKVIEHRSVSLAMTMGSSAVASATGPTFQEDFMRLEDDSQKQTSNPSRARSTATTPLEPFSPENDPSYIWTIVSWLTWMWKQTSPSSDSTKKSTQTKGGADDSNPSNRANKRRKTNKGSEDVVAPVIGVKDALLEGLVQEDEKLQIAKLLVRSTLEYATLEGPGANGCSPSVVSGVLAAADDSLAEFVGAISLSTMQPATINFLPDDDQSIEEMEARLKELQAKLMTVPVTITVATPAPMEKVTTTPNTSSLSQKALPRGWKQLTEVEWKPKSMGFVI